MKNISSKSTAKALALAGSLWAGPVLAESSDTSIALVDNAIEAQAITMLQDANGNVEEVVAKVCPVCAPQSFKTDSNVAYYLRDKLIGQVQAIQMSGAAGTVIYNINSRKAGVIILVSKGGK